MLVATHSATIQDVRKGNLVLVEERVTLRAAWQLAIDVLLCRTPNICIERFRTPYLGARQEKWPTSLISRSAT